MIAVPYRGLREYCANILLEKLLQEDIVIFMSKSEICPTYREQLREIYVKTLRKIAREVRLAEERIGVGRVFTRELLKLLAELYLRFKICRECEHRCDCEFYRNLKLLIAGVPKIYIMTHRLLQLLVYTVPHVFRRCIVVIDEVDQYIDVFRYAMSLSHVRVLKHLSKTDGNWSRVYATLRKQLVVSKSTKMFFLKPAMPRCLVAVAVSATVDIEDVINAYYIAHKRRPVLDVYTLPVKIVDKCVTCDNVIYVFAESGENVLKPEEAAKKIAEVTAELVDSGLKVGIASRSYDFTALLVTELGQYGVKFFADLKYKTTQHISVREARELARNADVVIWTTRGKLSRGVSLPDTDVIICTYQAAEIAMPTRTHVIDHVIMLEFEDIDEAPRLYTQKMCDAYNVQSYFRTNRDRDRQHVFLFADRRAWEAMIRTFREYAERSRVFRKWYQQELLKPKITDLRDVKHVVETVLSVVRG